MTYLVDPAKVANAAQAASSGHPHSLLRREHFPRFTPFSPVSLTRRRSLITIVDLCRLDYLVLAITILSSVSDLGWLALCPLPIPGLAPFIHHQPNLQPPIDPLATLHSGPGRKLSYRLRVRLLQSRALLHP